MAARLLGTKGVREFVAAAEILRSEGAKARFCLVGDLDPANPASISKQELDEWEKQRSVELLGSRSDIPALMAQAHFVVLPSYREGFPRVLIEAAACGRAIVTTDVPGCRDAIEDDITGVLVPAKDSVALAGAIRQLLENRAVCEAMGKAGRQRAVQIFDVNAVVHAHLNAYNALRKAS
jgi:glycosyltransferase involved in cell wall biosynthesis